VPQTDPDLEALADFLGTSTVLLIFSAIVNNREGPVHVLDWLIAVGRHTAILAQTRHALHRVAALLDCRDCARSVFSVGVVRWTEQLAGL
jgi:hypothetical protein